MDQDRPGAVTQGHSRPHHILPLDLHAGFPCRAALWGSACRVDTRAASVNRSSPSHTASVSAGSLVFSGIVAGSCLLKTPHGSHFSCDHVTSLFPVV